MNFESLNPHIRFINKFSYYPKEEVFVCGYDYRLFFITDGCVFLNFKDSSFTLSKHSLVLIPSEYPYKLTAADENGCELLCVNFDTVKGILSEKSVHPDSESDFVTDNVFEKEKMPELSIPIFIQDATELYDRLQEIYREFCTRHYGYRKKGEALLTSLIVSAVRSTKELPKKEVLLARSVREYLMLNLSNECSAECLGEVFHYHPNYINRVFKENVGITIHGFLIKQRIMLAKELLVASNMTLEKIALKCGFKTLSHFSLCFKNNCGVSPNTFRKNSDNIII